MKGAGSFAVGRTEFLGAGAGKASEKVAVGHTPRGGEGGSTVGILGGRGGQCEGPGAGRSLVSWARKEAKWLSHVADGKWGLLTLGVVLNSPLSHGKSFGGS